MSKIEFPHVVWERTVNGWTSRAVTNEDRERRALLASAFAETDPELKKQFFKAADDL